MYYKIEMSDFESPGFQGLTFDNRHLIKIDFSKVRRAEFRHSNIVDVPKIMAVIGNNGSFKTRFIRFLHDSVLKHNGYSRSKVLPTESAKTVGIECSLIDANDSNSFSVNNPRYAANTTQPYYHENWSPVFQVGDILCSGLSHYQHKFDSDVKRYNDAVSYMEGCKIVIDIPEPKPVDINAEVHKMNQHLTKFPYRISWDSSRGSIHGRDRFKVANHHTGTPMKVSDLSSGEQVMMRYLCLQFVHETEDSYPTLLLMDEPDRSLDQYNCKLFVESLNVLKKQGVQIIIATHRLETIKCLDEDSVFYLERKGDQCVFEKCTNMAASMKLTKELRNDSNFESIVVYVEGPSDEYFYTLLYEYYLKNIGLLGSNSNKCKATFISRRYRLKFIIRGGKDAVTNKIKEINSSPRVWNSPYGLIDSDNDHSNSGNFIVKLKRRELESYICELFIYLKWGLQDVTTVISNIRSSLDTSKIDETPDSKAVVEFSDGRIKIHEIQHPKWFSSIKTKDLIEPLKNSRADTKALSYRIFPVKVMADLSQQIEYRKPVYIPLEIIEIYSILSNKIRNQINRGNENKQQILIDDIGPRLLAQLKSLSNE